MPARAALRGAVRFILKRAADLNLLMFRFGIAMSRLAKPAGAAMAAMAAMPRARVAAVTAATAAWVEICGPRILPAVRFILGLIRKPLSRAVPLIIAG